MSLPGTDQETSHIWLAVCNAYNEGQSDVEALAAYVSSKGLIPASVSRLVRIGDALFQLEYYEEALTVYEQAI
jgi:hypothetical protein